MDSVEALPELELPSNDEKRIRKPNIEGYYRIPITKGEKIYEILLEKDKAEKQGLKLYYIKRKK